MGYFLVCLGKYFGDFIAHLIGSYIIKWWGKNVNRMDLMDNISWI
jgi:hypothetical protein